MSFLSEKLRRYFVSEPSDIRRPAEAADQNFDGINDEKSDSVNNAIRASKRKQKIDTASQEPPYSGRDAKKHQIFSREDEDDDYSAEYPDADYTMMLRRHLMSLNNALRKQWVCGCQKCSVLNVRLSLPPRKKKFDDEASFEVFFGVGSKVGIKLQEAKITINFTDIFYRRDMQSGKTCNSAPELAHICHCVRESLDDGVRLHLTLEGGLFQRLPPQPKIFAGDQMPQTVSLSALFQVQQKLHGNSSVMTTKGKLVLALTLATALFPFLETPWLQPSFDHSNILFVEPRPGELPDITRPFLALKRVSIVAGGETVPQVSSDSPEFEIHPDASVLALGILLCELHYSTSLVQKDLQRVRNVNDDFYTAFDLLETLKSDVGEHSLYFLATKACVVAEYNPFKEKGIFESSDIQRLFYHQVIKRLETELFSNWAIKPEDIGLFVPRQNDYWGHDGQNEGEANLPDRHIERFETRTQVVPCRLQSDAVPTPLNAQASPRPQSRGQSAEPSTGDGQVNDLSQQWMRNFLSSIDHYVKPPSTIDAECGTFEPVRIAILDSGFDREHFSLVDDKGQLHAQIKGMRNFVHPTTTPDDVQDEVGHGTHGLGLLLKVATCAEIYVAKIANQETLDPSAYDGIAKAIDCAVSEWKVDVISMSFGIREHHDGMRRAISNALHKDTLLFAAASNDGANLGRAFPAKYPGVFCIHSTDGNGNPSAFNPTADDKDVNFSLLGENVLSHWPFGIKDHKDSVKSISGTSVATPIAAGLAAAILSFVRQQEHKLVPAGDDKLLGTWLKEAHSMNEVFKSMVKQTRGQGYHYITAHSLFDKKSTRAEVYKKIMGIRRHLYD
ncbi:hypothetical protein V8C35DRAFT_320762 [Trichoderma chlorosporum]